MGNYLAGVRDLAIPVRTGIATSIAMGVSGLWGAYLTETAERQRELSELERAWLVDQSDTKIGRASRLAVVIVSVVDGLAPFLAALVVMTPLFLARLIGDVVTAIWSPSSPPWSPSSPSGSSLVTCPSGAWSATVSARSLLESWRLWSTSCWTPRDTRPST